MTKKSQRILTDGKLSMDMGDLELENLYGKKAVQRRNAIKIAGKHERLRLARQLTKARDGIGDVCGDKRFIKNELLRALVVEGGLDYRDAYILVARSRGWSYQKIADTAGEELTVGQVRYVVAGAADIITAMRDVVQMHSIGMMPELLEVQADIARNPLHDQNTKAFENIRKTANPTTGAQVNIATGGSSIHHGDSHQQANVQINELAGKSIEEIRAELDEADKKFQRPPPPGVEDGE